MADAGAAPEGWRHDRWIAYTTWRVSMWMFTAFSLIAFIGLMVNLFSWTNSVAAVMVGRKEAAIAFPIFEVAVLMVALTVFMSANEVARKAARFHRDWRNAEVGS